MLADPTEGIVYRFGFPYFARFPTPFLAGLSPDTRYFAYFTGGYLETVYGSEHWRASTPDLQLHVIELRSGEIIFSTPLLSPSFPQDLEPLAEQIKDDFWFTSSNATFEEVIAATQEMMLDKMLHVAWSPDSSLLAFAAQDPGPSSDMVFFDVKSGAVRLVDGDPAHFLHAYWAPDSRSVITDNTLFDRHARQDTTSLFKRDGAQLASFTSQIYWFAGWHDPTTALFYGATDAGDNFEPKALSALDGSFSLLFDGSFDQIAFTPDLSAFLLSSSNPSASAPGKIGLYLGDRTDGSLQTLDDTKYWGVATWGSERFQFAASTLDGGTFGVTVGGELVQIDDRYWDMAASPDGSYLAGYRDYRPSYAPGYLPGLRLFDGDGRLLYANDSLDITCVAWNAESSMLAYQDVTRIYVWNAKDGTTRLITDQGYIDRCALAWVKDMP
jgi:hypothetical protein